MTVYWMLFLLPALAALAYPVTWSDKRLSSSHSAALLLFLGFYVFISMFREEIGGDWVNYEQIYDHVAQSNLREALSITDPGFGLLLWLSAKMNLGIYPVNGVCAALLAVGVVRVALTTRDPWMAVIAAVPYLLIVVGLGYVRQAAAIGLILISIVQIGARRWPSGIVALLLAPTLHLTAAIAFPVVLRTLGSGRRWLSIPLLGLGLLLFYALLSTRLDVYQRNYIEEEYDSGGAMVRLAMNALPSLLILVRWRHFPIQGRMRDIWLGFAIVNMIAVVAMAVSPSSTAVDRMGLYFAPIQLVMFGCASDLLPVPRQQVLLLRALLIAILALVQTVWLVLGSYADAWVPYRWILET